MFPENYAPEVFVIHAFFRTVQWTVEIGMDVMLSNSYCWSHAKAKLAVFV